MFLVSVHEGHAGWHCRFKVGPALQQAFDRVFRVADGATEPDDLEVALLAQFPDGRTAEAGALHHFRLTKQLA